jgi:steroid delta-isomerase-like uncharacterized protein
MAINMKKVAADFIRAWNSHDVDKIASFFTDDCVYEDVAFGVVNRGKKEIKDFIKGMYVWSPDLKFELKSFFSARGRTASEWVMADTHAGEVPGIPATGKSFSVRGASIEELRGGKISRHSDYYNVVSFLQQVGLLPETPSQ